MRPENTYKPAVCINVKQQPIPSVFFLKESFTVHHRQWMRGIDFERIATICFSIAPAARCYIKSDLIMDSFVTALNSVQEDGNTANAILPLVYDELRRLAYSRMASQAASHTLQPTALVHEAWLRMVGEKDRTWQNRTHFFAAAATAMRTILIDHARKKTSLKRGGHLHRVDMEKLDVTVPEIDEFILLVEEALQRLEQVNPKWARIVVMKYHGGLTNKEAADALEMSESTIERYWAGAKAWLVNEISSQP